MQSLRDCFRQTSGDRGATASATEETSGEGPAKSATLTIGGSPNQSRRLALPEGKSTRQQPTLREGPASCGQGSHHRSPHGRGVAFGSVLLDWQANGDVA